MDAKEKRELLKDEYLLLQRFYEDCDTRILTIKGWSATVATAALGLGFYQSRYLWLFAALASLFFWWVEATWKRFQYCFAGRIQVIEKGFAGEAFDSLQPFQIYTSWFKAWQLREITLWLCFRLPIVAFPHVATIVVGVGLFILDAVGRQRGWAIANRQ
jgi:hypothetical protein